MEIKRLEYDFSVCKVVDYSQVNLDDEYCFIGKTDEESIAFVLRFAGVKRTSHADFIFDCQTDESASAGEAAEGQGL